LDGEVRHFPDIALGHEEIDQPVIVDVLELGVPGGAEGMISPPV
jgi:hypothetical protein